MQSVIINVGGNLETVDLSEGQSLTVVDGKLTVVLTPQQKLSKLIDATIIPQLIKEGGFITNAWEDSHKTIVKVTHLKKYHTFQFDCKSFDGVYKYLVDTYNEKSAYPDVSGQVCSGYTYWCKDL